MLVDLSSCRAITVIYFLEYRYIFHKGLQTAVEMSQITDEISQWSESAGGKQLICDIMCR